jgi:hypothetical protein
LSSRSLSPAAARRCGRDRDLLAEKDALIRPMLRAIDEHVSFSKEASISPVRHGGGGCNQPRRPPRLRERLSTAALALPWPRVAAADGEATNQLAHDAYYGEQIRPRSTSRSCATHQPANGQSPPPSSASTSSPAPADRRATGGDPDADERVGSSHDDRRGGDPDDVVRGPTVHARQRVEAAAGPALQPGGRRPRVAEKDYQSLASPRSRRRADAEDADGDRGCGRQPRQHLPGRRTASGLRMPRSAPAAPATSASPACCSACRGSSRRWMMSFDASRTTERVPDQPYKVVSVMDPQTGIPRGAARRGRRPAPARRSS